MKFKLYKSFFIALGFMLIVIVISLIQYSNDYFSKKLYLEWEYIRDNCHDSYDDVICRNRNIKDEISYKEVMDNESVFASRKKLDIKELGFTIIEFYFFFDVSVFMPLITAILVCLMISKDTSTGFYQHILTRDGYKSYLFKKFKSVSFLSLVQPISILMVFILSAFYTNLNFSSSSFHSGLAVYSYFKDKYFILSVLLIMFISFILNFIYSIISLRVAINEKSVIVAIVKSYLTCVLLVILDYFIGCIITFIILGIEGRTMNFDILSYITLNKDLSFLIVFINLIILLSISMVMFFIKYGRKEKFYNAIEKENAII